MPSRRILFKNSKNLPGGKGDVPLPFRNCRVPMFPVATVFPCFLPVKHICVPPYPTINSPHPLKENSLGYSCFRVDVPFFPMIIFICSPKPLGDPQLCNYTTKMM